MREYNIRIKIYEIVVSIPYSPGVGDDPVSTHPPPDPPPNQVHPSIFPHFGLLFWVSTTQSFAYATKGTDKPTIVRRSNFIINGIS